MPAFCCSMSARGRAVRDKKPAPFLGRAGSLSRGYIRLDTLRGPGARCRSRVKAALTRVVTSPLIGCPRAALTALLKASLMEKPAAECEDEEHVGRDGNRHEGQDKDKPSQQSAGRVGHR